MLTIDGLTMPAPVSMILSYESVGRSEITADGALAADRLAIKRRAKIVWRGLERVAAAQVLGALTQGVFLAVALPDPRAGEMVSLTMTVISLDAELMDTTPLNAGWRIQRPVRLKMLFRPTDAGQALVVQKYRTGESLSVSLVLPDGNTLGWQGWVRGLTFSAAHPDAPVTLEAAVCVNGEAEVSA